MVKEKNVYLVVGQNIEVIFFFFKMLAYCGILAYKN